MVFKAKDANTYKIKVRIPGRKPRTFSTGMTNKAAAMDVERMVDRFKSRREWAPLVAIFDDLTTLAEVYDADVRGALDDLLAKLRDTDLDPLVTEWATRANAKYVRQVRRLIVDSERFPSSTFRRKRISEFLAGLTCDDPTRNRYRAALSVFAKWLVEREVLETNPVRDVAMYKEHDPRMVWMTWEQAQRVAIAAPAPYDALFALMAATGIELGTALALTRRDVDLTAQTIHAHGSKTSWRNRVVQYEAWAQGDLYRLTSAKVGASLLFPGVGHADALDTFKSAQKAVGLSGHRLHDLRHTYAVNSLKAGRRPTVVAHQLGHKDASMVTKCYGRFVPDKSDYTATNPATSTSRKARGKHA